MFQRWDSNVFFHWPVAPAILKRLLPPELEVDTHGGMGWISITPFLVARLRAPFVPALPWISEFPETNLRTYVVGPGGRTGIWFFSLDCARLPAVIGARSLYGLRYFHAKMSVEKNGRLIQYRSLRADAADTLTNILVEPGISLPAVKDERDHFLTERYRLYASLSGRLVYADVEHEPWPLHEVGVQELTETLTDAAGLPKPSGEPLAHFSPGVDVRIGAPHDAVA
jgi:uncharacterized protein